MSLLLTVYSTPAWQALANVSGLPLTNASPAIINSPALLQPVQPLAALPTLILLLSDGHTLWVAVEQAEHYLADAIESGSTLANAAEQWKEQTAALLTLQRQHRRQLQLFNLQQALAQPVEFRENLGSTLSIANYPPQPIDNSLALLAACQYVAQQPELRALNTRLQASVLALSESESLTPDIDQILQHNQATATQLAAAIKERDLIFLHLQEVQEQLESCNSENAAHLAATIEERDQVLLRLHQAQEQLEKCNQISATNLAAAQSERDLALDQLSNTQEQLAIFDTEINRLQLALQIEEQKDKHAALARDKQQAKEIAKLESELRKTKAWASSTEYAGQLLKQELTELRNSTLWRATNPVRKLGSLVRKTDKAHEKLVQDIALLLTSEYFDINWYLHSYPDIAESKMNPAEHYLLYGAAEGRLPGPLFDGNWYIQHYPDVSTAGVNPLLHFIMFGQQEGRSSSPKMLTNNSQNAEE